jgi:hypothetical protein
LDKSSSKQYIASSKLTQIADIESGKTDILFNEERPFSIYLDSKLLKLQESSRFNLVVNNIYMKSFLTLEILENIDEFKEIFFPLNPEDFYTEPFDVDHVYNTNFYDLQKMKNFNAIRLNKLFKEEIQSSKSNQIFASLDLSFGDDTNEQNIAVINNYLSEYSKKKKKIQLTNEILLESNKFLIS